jgi:hypothetical protein
LEHFCSNFGIIISLLLPDPDRRAFPDSAPMRLVGMYYATTAFTFQANNLVEADMQCTFAVAVMVKEVVLTEGVI